MGRSGVVADVDRFRDLLADRVTGGRLVLRPWSDDKDEPGVGQLLGMGRRQTYDRIASGEIPSIRLGRRIMVPVAGLLRMLDEDQ